MKERIVISRSLPISLYPSLELGSWDSLMPSRRYVVGIRRGDEGTRINGREEFDFDLQYFTRN